MERPKNRAYGRLSSKPLLALLALFSLLLTGFLSTSKGQQEAKEVALDIDLLIKKVSSLNQQKEHQKAIDLLLSAVEKEKEDSLVRALLVQTFDLFLEEEIQKGQEEIKENRKNLAAYNRVASAFELLGDNFRAMEALLGGINYDAVATDLWVKIARLELKANRDMEALDVFKEVIRLSPQNSDAYNNAAYILARAQDSDMHDLAEAEQLANRARLIDPANPEYIDTLAEVQFKRGNKEKAQSLMREAIRLAPEKDIFKNHLNRYESNSSAEAAE